ncbi:N-acetylmuramate alpha-1-phosphate uridylyltransferase MurU [Piscinibacter sp. HJYY11]|uniref:N-acetylmuramate alpha-1-phosphate uridylyltransferase MurU n=1 Tax=Piscinibacter sp. HJYY11 TaxID=2801333 RepID=UPI00191DA553|nr:nucleotidyltransferase family protein [Piscinibacter sp. HJYY11]MBL0728660.1 nucleotidyltransferase family protein [Piscinibacter sp. HJYY11]
MKALILAAGRGERMRPLTDHTPKPLLEVQGKPLIVWHLEALARDGIRDVVINTAWLEERIVDTLGDGARYGVSIRYSLEGRDHGGALETAGGIAKALPLLTDTTLECFWVVSGDVFLPGFRFDTAAAQRFATGGALAHLWLVPNAPHHPEGDFGIDAQGRASRTVTPKRTWASVGLFRAAIVNGVKVGDKLPLTPLLRAGADAGRIEATAYDGPWTDVGTVERLNALNTDPP